MRCCGGRAVHVIAQSPFAVFRCFLGAPLGALRPRRPPLML
ncbi:Protein of unknown function [Gryllus bimaculatus]|nr:Protein of unknown function [Gryllus bimaculatus]